jgi:uncharacterized protein YcfJ
MNNKLKLALLLAAGVAATTPAAAQITFYDGEGYNGRAFTTNKPVGNLERSGFNDRAASAVVARDRWEVCDDAGFKGHCAILRPGNYPSLAAMGLGDRISSLRMVASSAHFEDHRYAPEPIPANDYRRRDRERIYEAPVTSVRVVMAQAEQRCWVERQDVPQQDSGVNVPGAVAGAVIGGILGHQVGGGHGQDLATVAGAVAGGAVGANVGRNGGAHQQQDVQRCSNKHADARPAYWDVTYKFRGLEHRVQLTSAPAATITVNELGEPRA